MTTWTITAAGHKSDGGNEQAEVKEALRELVRDLRQRGHTVNVHTVNDQDVEAE